MKIRVTLEVDVNFDLESDGEVGTEASDVDSDLVGQAVGDSLRAGEFLDEMVENITNKSGWCVNSLNLTTTDIECVDYLG